MAKPDFLIKRNDSLPAMRVALKNPDGTPFTNLTGATFKLFFQAIALDPITGAKVTGVGVFTVVGTGSTGEVDYAWNVADTANIGRFRAEIEVLPLAGGRTTFPGAGYILFDVVQDLGDG